METLEFLKTQWHPVPYPTQSFNGKTIIVTGSNIGLGLEAARHFVRLGASKVILGCRSISKGEEAASSIATSTGRQAICEVWQLDLGNFDSVKEFAKRAEGLERLDIVVENAGVSKTGWTETEGMETTVAINVVGTFLLALNLLPVLRRSKKQFGIQPVLTITSSEVHAWSHMNERFEDSIFEALKKNDPKYIAERYPTSKLLEVFTVRELAVEMNSGPHSDESIVLNTVNPGFCHSSLSRDTTGVQAFIFWLMKALLARTTEVGGRTLVASAAAGQESHGKYMSECNIKEPSPFVRSEEGKKTQKRVYNELKAILEKIQPGVTKNI